MAGGGTTAATPILLHRLQLLNVGGEGEAGAEQAGTSSNAAHLYIISPDTVTVRDSASKSCIRIASEGS